MDRVKDIENRLDKLHKELGGSSDRIVIIEEMERLENQKALLCKIEKQGVE